MCSAIQPSSRAIADAIRRPKHFFPSRALPPYPEPYDQISRVSGKCTMYFSSLQGHGPSRGLAEAQERAAPPHLGPQLRVPLLRAVDPVNRGRPRQLAHLVDPAQEMFVGGERNGTIACSHMSASA